MGHLTGVRGRLGRAGFTLVELLLTVALFLLLASVAVFNFGSLQRGAPLEEGAAMMESLFRYTRAQAASTGRTLRVVFSEGTGAVATTTNYVASTPGSVQVLWEADPLGAPGQFAVLTDAGPFTDRLNELIEVRAVQSVAASSGTPSTYANLAAGAEVAAVASVDSTNAPSGSVNPGFATPWPPVVFYPDGSSDSVEVWLASRDADDSRQLGVALSGVVGTTRRKWRTLDPNGAVGAESDVTEMADEADGKDPAP